MEGLLELSGIHSPFHNLASNFIVFLQPGSIFADLRLTHTFTDLILLPAGGSTRQRQNQLSFTSRTGRPGNPSPKTEVPKAGDPVPMAENCPADQEEGGVQGKRLAPGSPRLRTGRAADGGAVQRTPSGTHREADARAEGRGSAGTSAASEMWEARRKLG